MSSLLKKFDILGINPVIYYNSKRRKKTLIGGVFSIITLILISLVILYFIIESISKTSYSVIYNQMTGSNLELNLSKIPYAFGIFTENGIPIQNMDNIIKISGEYIKINITDNIYTRKMIQFNLEKCQKKHFLEYMTLIENEEILKNFYCIPENNSNFSLFGSFQDFLSSNTGLFIKFFKNCNRKINEENILTQLCSNKPVTDNNLSDIYINTIFPDYEIDHTNNKKPVKMILQSNIFPIGTQRFSEYSIKKRVVNYVSNEGYFLNDFKEYTFHQDESIHHYTDNLKSNGQDTLFVNFSISLSRKTDYHYRNYLKLQTAFANCSGIAEGIFFIFSNLLKLIMKNDYFFDLGILSYIISEETNEKTESDKFFVISKNFQMNANMKRKDNLRKTNIIIKRNFLNENLNESINNSDNNIFTKNFVTNKDFNEKTKPKIMKINKDSIKKSYFHFLPCLKKSQKKMNELLEIIIKKDLSVESLIKLINSQEFLNSSLIEKNGNEFYLKNNINKSDHLLKSKFLNNLYFNKESKFQKFAKV